MADQVSGIAGGIAGGVPGGVPGSSLGGLTGALQGGIANLVNTGQGYLDQWFPPEKREEVKARMVKFATERPKLAAFLLSQIAISGFPLALFVIMSLTIFIFALVAALLVAVIGALLFTVFCLGIALIILLPTLFMTTFAACFIFLWGLGTYYIIKWFNEKEIPGIHIDFVDGVKKQAGLAGIPALNGELPGPLGGEAKAQPSPLQEKKDTNASHDDEKENKAPHSPSKPRRAQTPSGKGTGADFPGVGDLKKKTGNITAGAGL